MDELRQSTRAQTRAAQVSGLTRYDLVGRVRVPDGTSTMVAILNEGRIVASGPLEGLVEPGETLEDLFVRVVRG